MFHRLSEVVVKFLLNDLRLPYDAVVLLPFFISVAYIVMNRKKWKDGSLYSRYYLIGATLLAVMSLVGEIILIGNRSVIFGH